MIAYSIKTKRLPTSGMVINNDGNGYKMVAYDKDLFFNVGGYENQERLTKDVFNTYYSLVSFNNQLDLNVKSAFSFLDKFISDHIEIKTSKDFRCRNLYDEMEYWNNKYKLDSSFESVKQICDKVQKLLEQLEKQKIVKKSSCNLKKNYY